MMQRGLFRRLCPNTACNTAQEGCRLSSFAELIEAGPSPSPSVTERQGGSGLIYFGKDLQDFVRVVCIQNVMLPDIPKIRLHAQ